MGFLILAVFSSTTACIHASQERIRPPALPSSTHIPPFDRLSLSNPLPGTLSPFAPARFPSCGSRSLYFCYPVRTPSSRPADSFVNLLLSSIYCPFVFLVFFSFSCFAPPFGRFRLSTLEFLSRLSTHLIFDTSSQGVSKKCAIEICKHMKFTEQPYHRFRRLIDWCPLGPYLGMSVTLTR